MVWIPKCRIFKLQNMKIQPLNITYPKNKFRKTISPELKLECFNFQKIKAGSWIFQKPKFQVSKVHILNVHLLLLLIYFKHFINLIFVSGGPPFRANLLLGEPPSRGLLQTYYNQLSRQVQCQQNPCRHPCRHPLILRPILRLIPKRRFAQNHFEHTRKGGSP